MRSRNGKPGGPGKQGRPSAPGRGGGAARGAGSGAQKANPQSRFGAKGRVERKAGGGFGGRPERSTRAAPETSRKILPERGDDWEKDAPAIVAPVAEAPEITAVQTVAVSADETGMRVDRFLEAKIPGLSFAHIQRMVRKGELRVDGKRVDSKDRLEEGQKVRIPPVRREAPPRPDDERRAKVRAELREMTLFEDDDVLVINKPYGLAVQGGSGTTRHVDDMLMALMEPDGQRPRLVHRLDKDTAGCLVIAKTRFAASTLAKTFRSRSARKIYWALVSGVPRVRQGRISTFVAREEQDDGDSRMRVVRQGEEGASHALTFYAVVETSAQKLAWLSLKPVTGRTHQLRVHTAEMGHPIVGDPKYFNIENWNLPGGIQNRLHLLARRIVLPHPRGKGVIDVSAPLPPHMQQSWNLLGFDAKRYDPILDAPDD